MSDAPCARRGECLADVIAADGGNGRPLVCPPGCPRYVEATPEQRQQDLGGLLALCHEVIGAWRRPGRGKRKRR